MFLLWEYNDLSGALYVDEMNTNIAFISTIVSQNSARWDAGGVMVLSKNTHITFSFCDFVENEAIGNDGGGIYLREENSDILISNSTVSFNRAKADNGGGIYVWKYNRNVSITHSVFG